MTISWNPNKNTWAGNGTYKFLTRIIFGIQDIGKVLATKNSFTEDVEQIINYDPRVKVNALTIDSTDQGIRIQADVVYLPFNINERMTFDFDKTNNIVN